MLSFHKWSATETLGSAGLLTERDWNQAFPEPWEPLPKSVGQAKETFSSSSLSPCPCNGYF